MRALLLVLFCLLALPAAAQVPDTTAPWRYYPLGLGDRWVYEVVDMQGPPCLPNNPCRYYLVWEVVGDTLLDDRTYAVRRMRSYLLDGTPASGSPYPSGDALLRFDTLSAHVLRPGANGEEWPETGCPLDTPFPADSTGGPAEGCGDGPFWMQGSYRWEYEVGGRAYAGPYKHFFFGGIWDEAYAADLGVVRYALTDLIEYAQHLHYARVGGVEYGTPVQVGAEPVPAAPPALAFGTYPNPFAEAVTLTLSLPMALALHIEVFDVQGRRLHQESQALAAGQRVLRLDGSGWAPGVYLVRVTGADGQAAMARVVRR
ncbi:MAG TPA: T9SS type A sorting domain-containing protein [Rubricoccaceae bacterium]|nr:T9SS type A sorting domain-containing protein [Rubricoccaceae bacterium]